MSLVVDRIKAVEESDEEGSDDIYLITFRGRTKSPFDTGMSSIGPGDYWDDFDSGEKENTDHTIAKSFSDAVYAVMMVEEDNGKDIAGNGFLGVWKVQTSILWKAIMLSMLTAGVDPSSKTAKDAGFAGIRTALKDLATTFTEFPFGNDEALDLKRVTITKKGQTQTLRFASTKENARYDVTFKVT